MNDRDRICPACGAQFRARHAAQRLCSVPCARAAYFRPPRSSQETQARFMSRVSPEPTSGCWLWTGKYGNGGYAWLNGPAHRNAWERFIGPVPKGIDVCHRCDNRGCVNPSHLFLGTRLDNMRDCVTKGRHARGLGNGLSKLTGADVCAIRAMLQAGKTQRAVAARYGVGQNAVWKIATGQTWAHVHRGDQR